LHRSTASGAAFYCLLLIGRMLWAKLLGAKIVWTVHNLRSHHTAHPVVEKWFWRIFVPLVNACIHLSRAGRELALDTFPGLASKSHSIVPHGHYRGCYLNDFDRKVSRLLLGIRSTGPVIAFVGQIKAYKNISGLIRAFIEAAQRDPQALLVIAGRPGDSAIEAELRNAAQGHPRILFHFGLIPNDRMHLYLNACDLAVFPYREILNSGSAILALSFDRPALVPARGAMGELRQLAGPDWVYTFEGDLTGPVLSAALEKAAAAGRPARCDLASLGWESIAAGTLAGYRAVARSAAPDAFAVTAPA